MGASLKAYALYIDGASKGNPGEAGSGVAIYDPGGLLIGEEGRYIGRATNNEAEYIALLRALEMAQQLGLRNIVIFSDSELLVRQMNGIYRVKSPKLKVVYDAALAIINGFDSAELRYISRRENKKADSLANMAIEEGRSKSDDRSRHGAGEESPSSAEQGAG